MAAGTAISVIVAAYRQPETLAWLLQSLSCQVFSHPWELLICDDGSAGGLLSVLQRHFQPSASRPEIRYLWQPDLGFRLSRSRNNAIRCASGDRLVFLDGDMLVGPQFLQAHYNAHADGDGLVCSGRRSLVVPPAIAAGPALMFDIAWAFSTPGESEEQEAWVRSAYPWMACIGCNFSVPRSPHVYFEERLVGWGSEDRELAVRLHCYQALPVRYCKESESLHIGMVGEAAPNNPIRSNDSAGIKRFVRNKLMFSSLHPATDITPALAPLRCCFYDPKSNIWFSRRPLADRDIATVVEEVTQWLEWSDSRDTT
ncbi:MAG: glycosyltransferase [Bryobacterales bacterium]|nr:glycosyltransferase [Bryobacterales bacterium]